MLQGRPAPRRQLPRLHGRAQGRTHAGAELLPRRGRRHGSAGHQRARTEEPEDGGGDAAVGHARRRLQVDRRRRHAAARRTERVGREARRRRATRAQGLAPRAARCRRLAPCDGCQPRCLHPVQPLRASLPRGAGQRRHRLCDARRAFEDRLRPRRPHGRQHLRGLRRMRAGLPDRRADAQEPHRFAAGRPQGRLGVPVLRRGLSHHLQRQGREDCQRGRSRRPGQSQPPVREGPLRLRLRAPSAAAHQAAHSQARRAQELRRRAPARATGARCSAKRVGKKRWPSRPATQGLARHARQDDAGRLRLRQGQQRGGLPVPEAGAHRIRQQQRRPLHAAVPCVERRGAARRRRLGRGEQPGQRRRACRADLHHRLQPDRQSSGGRHLDEERREARHEDRARGPAAHRHQQASMAYAAVQGRHRRRHAQCAHPRGDRRGSGRRGIRPRPCQQLRGAARERQGLQPRGDGADLRHSGRDHCARSPAPSRPPRAR